MHMVVPVGRIFSLIGFTLIDNELPDVWADRGHGDHVDTILTQSFFSVVGYNAVTLWYEKW